MFFGSLVMSAVTYPRHERRQRYWRWVKGLRRHARRDRRGIHFWNWLFADMHGTRKCARLRRDRNSAPATLLTRERFLSLEHHVALNRIISRVTHERTIVDSAQNLLSKSAIVSRTIPSAGGIQDPEFLPGRQERLEGTQILVLYVDADFLMDQITCCALASRVIATVYPRAAVEWCSMTGRSWKRRMGTISTRAGVGMPMQPMKLRR